METRRVRQCSSTGPCHPWQRQMSLIPSPPSPPLVQRSSSARPAAAYRHYILSSATVHRHCRTSARPPPPSRPRPPTLLFAADGNRIFPPQNKPGSLPVHTHPHTHTQGSTIQCICAASMSRCSREYIARTRARPNRRPFFFPPT